jgi:hypothetical protein
MTIWYILCSIETFPVLVSGNEKNLATLVSAYTLLKTDLWPSDLLLQTISRVILPAAHGGCEAGVVVNADHHLRKLDFVRTVDLILSSKNLSPDDCRSAVAESLDRLW